ncbi:MAG: hypothetical protein IKI11_11585, partial [Neisseriaceae bacterium]|nr:hypothetical protein [Neisseriaceae bacterium]
MMNNKSVTHFPCQKCGEYKATFINEKLGFLCPECKQQAIFPLKKHTNKPPQRIICHNCGSSAEFDIVEQTYRCAYCKQTTGLENRTPKHTTWRRLAFADKQRQPLDLQQYSCPSCGAKVVFSANEAVQTCDFCASKLVRHQFNEEEQLPDLIIPFFITADEAKQRFLAWAKQHKRSAESKKIIQHIEQMQTYYLPYRMVKGEVNGLIHRDGVERLFHCKAYIRNMAVNTSKQLDNLLLNEIEPFDWSKSQAFEYAHIAGQKVKLTDISEKEIHNRVLEETEDEFLPEIQKTFHSRAVEVKFKTDSNFLNKNALLPIYFIKDGFFNAFMNGQTGRISASCGKEKRYFNSWIIKATLLTLISYLSFVTLLLYFGKRPLIWEDIIEILSASAGLWFFMTIIIFGLFSEKHERLRIFQRKTKQSSHSKSYRQNKKLHITENDQVENYHTLVFQEEYLDTKLKITQAKNTTFFYEQYSRQIIPVKIKFFPLKRIALMGLNCFIFTFFPVIIALFIRPLVMISKGENIFQFFDGISIIGGFMWYVAFCPFYYLYYLSRGLNRFVYEKPFIYQIMPDGSQKHIKEFDTNIFFDIFPALNIKELKENVFEYFMQMFIIGFIVFLVLAISVFCCFSDTK